jgi:cytochrome c-type biogenesis protein CcmH
MRATVRDQLAAGRTPDEVRQYFVDRYGEWILLEPKASGFNLLVYVLPWLALLAGLTFIVLAVRRWTRPLPAGDSAETPVATTMDS